MIAETVAMAERGYDRWYLLAHSQGSRARLQRDEETEWTLPNYLQESQYRRLPQAFKTNTPFLPAQGCQARSGSDDAGRPAWLTGDEGLSRKELFKTFRGL